MQEETADKLAFLRISNLICILMKWRLDHSNLNPTGVALVAQMAKEQHLQHRRPGFNSWVGKIPWRGEWQPTPLFLIGKSLGPRSLVGYSPWGHRELDTTERLTLNFYISGLLTVHGLDCTQ